MEATTEEAEPVVAEMKENSAEESSGAQYSPLPEASWHSITATKKSFVPPAPSASSNHLPHVRLRDHPLHNAIRYPCQCVVLSRKRAVAPEEVAKAPFLHSPDTPPRAALPQMNWACTTCYRQTRACAMIPQAKYRLTRQVCSRAANSLGYKRLSQDVEDLEGGDAALARAAGVAETSVKAARTAAVVVQEGLGSPAEVATSAVFVETMAPTT